MALLTRAARPLQLFSLIWQS